MPSWRKLRLALIVIVDGILICDTHPVKPSSLVVEMVKDLDVFFAYPWGRLSFDRTLQLVRATGDVDVSTMLKKKLHQTSVTIHGFPVVIQLFVFHAVPQLLHSVRGKDFDATFLQQRFRSLPTLKAFHNDTLLEVEKRATVLQPFTLDGKLESSSQGDKKVAAMLQLLESGYKFSVRDWFLGCPSSTLLSRSVRSPSGRAPSVPPVKFDVSSSAPAKCTATPPLNDEVSQLRLEVCQLKASRLSVIEHLQRDIVNDIEKMLSERLFAVEKGPVRLLPQVSLFSATPSDPCERGKASNCDAQGQIANKGKREFANHVISKDGSPFSPEGMRPIVADSGDCFKPPNDFPHDSYDVPTFSIDQVYRRVVLFMRLNR